MAPSERGPRAAAALAVLARAGSALALFLTAACGGDAAPELRCTLSSGSAVASADAARFHAIALDARGQSALAAWSSRAGLFVRRLDARGSATAPAVQLGPPCRGGVDVELGADGVLVGCVRPAEDEEASRLSLYTLSDALAVQREQDLGRVGRDGHGVDVELDGRRTHVLHHDGTVGAYALRWITLEGESRSEAQLARPGRAASQPALFLDGAAAYAAFTESDHDRPDRSTTDVMVARAGEAARALVRVAVDDPAPRLSRDAAGLVLTYRDQPPRERKPELYAVRLSASLALAGKPVKVGRANSEGAPALHVCGGARLGILPREYGGERYIALHALGPALENLSQGHQFFANGRDYVLAAGACLGEELLALVGEQKSPADGGVELLALRFGCE